MHKSALYSSSDIPLFIYLLKCIVYFMFPSGCTANPIWLSEEWRTSLWIWPSPTLGMTPMTPTSTSTSPEKFPTSTSGRRSVPLVTLEVSAVYLLECVCLFLKCFWLFSWKDVGEAQVNSWTLYREPNFTHTHCTGWLPLAFHWDVHFLQDSLF